MLIAIALTGWRRSGRLNRDQLAKKTVSPVRTHPYRLKGAAKRRWALPREYIHPRDSSIIIKRPRTLFGRVVTSEEWLAAIGATDDESSCSTANGTDSVDGKAETVAAKTPDMPAVEDVFPNVTQIILRLSVRRDYKRDQENRITARVHSILHKIEGQRSAAVKPEPKRPSFQCYDQTYVFDGDVRRILRRFDGPRSAGIKLKPNRAPFQSKDNYFTRGPSSSTFDMPELFHEVHQRSRKGNYMGYTSAIEIKLRDWTSIDLEWLLSALRQSRSIDLVQARTMSGEALNRWHGPRDPDAGREKWWHRAALILWRREKCW